MLNKVTANLWEEISLYVSKRNIVIGFGIIILFNLVLLPGFPKIFSVNNIYALDLNFGYSAKEAYYLLALMSGKERIVYLLSEIIIDWPYAVFYSFFYSIIIVAVFKKSNFNFVKYFLWFPLLIGLFDILENFFIVLTILFFSSKLAIFANLAGLFTSLKWSFAGLTFLAVIIGIINKLLAEK